MSDTEPPVPDLELLRSALRAAHAAGSRPGMLALQAVCFCGYPNMGPGGDLCGRARRAPPAPGNLSASRPTRSRRTLAIARRQALETWEQWWASLPAGVRTLYDEVAAAADPDAAVLTRYEALQGTGAVAGVQVYSGGHVEVVRAE